MYKKNAVNRLSGAIKDVILPKFTVYLEDRRNDVSIQELIEKEVEHIEDLEDLVFNMTDSIDFSEFKSNNITLDNYNFRYNKELEDFEFNGDKELAAKGKILYQEGLTTSWTISNMISRRIDAILVTLEETSFDEILDIVEDQIDFNEFISTQKPR